MKHIGSIAVSFWIFVMPTLCLAGVFTHACADCSDEACAHEADCIADPCAHEEDCFADPCADVGVPPIGLILRSINPVASSCAVTLLPAGTIELPAPGRTIVPSSHGPDCLLPVHASDRPLLI